MATTPYFGTVLAIEAVLSSSYLIFCLKTRTAGLKILSSERCQPHRTWRDPQGPERQLSSQCWAIVTLTGYYRNFPGAWIWHLLFANLETWLISDLVVLQVSLQLFIVCLLNKLRESLPPTRNGLRFCQFILKQLANPGLLLAFPWYYGLNSCRPWYAYATYDHATMVRVRARYGTSDKVVCRTMVDNSMY